MLALPLVLVGQNFLKPICSVDVHSAALTSQSRRLGFPVQLIKTTSQLVGVLEQRNWREWPMLYDVPGGPHIFGGVAMDAGIEGILYRSVITGVPA